MTEKVNLQIKEKKDVKKLLILALFMIGICAQAKENTQHVVNVLGWHEQIPHSIIQAFEKETGIKVNLDVLESNEILEAKLLAGNTGYDVVFPTAWPYVARQAASGLYEKIDPTKLSHYKNIDPLFLERMTTADPGNSFAIPYTWGVVAIGYNPEIIDKHVPKEKQDSWALIYDPEVLKNLQGCGVTLLEDPLDVFLTYYLYKGENPLDPSLKKLKEMSNKLKEIRHFIKRFSTSLVAEKLGNNELCAVMHWRGTLSMAKGKFNGIPHKQPMKIILPKEGSLLWIDCIAIPKEAPHIDNAHKFIDFLLRTQSAAKITTKTYTATTIKESLPLLTKEMRDNKTIFPSAAYMKKVVLPEVKSLQFQRRMSRFFAAIMTHKESK